MFSKLPIISNIVSEVGETVREIIPDKDQADRLVSAITNVFVKHEADIIKEQSANIRAEVASKSWLARNWRPITMLTFLGLVAAHWLGYTAENVTEAEVLSMMDLIKIGLGGYVVGRSAEKIAPMVIEGLKKK